ncbi:hypothetical protein BV20DRAFT_924757, partial [Pilatotrama ljubarskyi]
LFFAPTVDSDNLFVCCICPSPPPSMSTSLKDEIDSLPLILNLTGTIATEECFITVSGNPRKARPDHVQDQPVASCWLQPLSADPEFRSHWSQVTSAIARVASTAPVPLNTSRIIRTTSDGSSAQLRVRFAPESGHSLRNTLPFYDKRTRIRCVPKSIGEVPFGRPLQAAFILEYVRENEQSFLFADLVSLTDI